MATLPGNGRLPPPGPSTRQASRRSLHTQSSAARSCAHGRQKLKLHKGTKLTKARSQLEYSEVRNTLAFEYSARSPATNVSTPAANAIRQTAPAVQVCRRNTAPYLHYLQRKIDQTISKIDSYNCDLGSKVILINSKISSNARNIEVRIQFLNAIRESHSNLVRELKRLKDGQDTYVHDLDKKLLKESHDKVVREIEYLNKRKKLHVENVTTLIKSWKCDEMLDVHELNRMIKYLTGCKDYFNQRTANQIRELNVLKELYASDLNTQMTLLNAKKDSNADDLDKQMKSLSATQDSMVRDLTRESQLLIDRINSQACDLDRRCVQFNDQVTLYNHDIMRQTELVDSKIAPFVHDLDGQRKLLGSKIDSFYQNCGNQQDRLKSNVNRYKHDVHQKMKLLESCMVSFVLMGGRFGCELWYPALG